MAYVKELLYVVYGSVRSCDVRFYRSGVAYGRVFVKVDDGSVGVSEAEGVSSSHAGNGGAGDGSAACGV